MYEWNRSSYGSTVPVRSIGESYSPGVQAGYVILPGVHDALTADMPRQTGLMPTGGNLPPVSPRLAVGVRCSLTGQFHEEERRPQRGRRSIQLFYCVYL